MPMLTNKRMERFARALVDDGLSAAEAYVKGGYKPDRGNAVHLQQHPLVVQRVNELLQDRASIDREATQRAVEALRITKDGLISEFKAIAEEARQDGQHAAAVSAFKEISILSGHRIERQEAGLPGEFAALEAMGRDQLLVVVQQLLEGDEVPALEGQRQLSGKQ
jgi:hypothetical protein